MELYNTGSLFMFMKLVTLAHC